MKKNNKQSKSFYKVKISKVDKNEIKTRFFSKPVYLSFVLNIISMAFILLIQKHLPPQIPLYYGLPEGEAQLVSPLWLLLPAVICFILTAINSFLSIYLKNNFIKKLPIFTSITLSAFSTITIFEIAFLIGQF